MESKIMILKVHVAGESFVGKTSLLVRAAQDKFYQQYQVPTIGLDFYIKHYEFDKQRVKVQYWDIAGAERYYRFRNPSFRNSQVVLLCFALDEPLSFERLPNWINEIRMITQDCIFYLVGCKCDLEQTVPQEKQGLVYFKCSTKEDIGIRDNFDRIIQTAFTEITNDPDRMAKMRFVPQNPPPPSSFCHI